MSRVPYQAEVVVCDVCGKEAWPEDRPHDSIPGFRGDGTSDWCPMCQRLPHECAADPDDEAHCARCEKRLMYYGFEYPDGTWVPAS